MVRREAHPVESSIGGNGGGDGSRDASGRKKWQPQKQQGGDESRDAGGRRSGNPKSNSITMEVETPVTNQKGARRLISRSPGNNYYLNFYTRQRSVTKITLPWKAQNRKLGPSLKMVI